ncbi:MAG: hypothetical protein R3B13_04080 [Polyangiaceae bacterium]
MAQPSEPETVGEFDAADASTIHFGIPAAVGAFVLTRARVDAPDRVVLGYHAERLEGGVNVVVMPRASIARQVRKLQRIALYYESSWIRPNLAQRTEAAELVQQVGASVDAYVDARGSSDLMAAIAELPALSNPRLDVAGLRDLLPEFVTPPRADAAHLVDAYPSDAGVVLEVGSEESTSRILLEVVPGAGQAKFHAGSFAIRSNALGPGEGDDYDDAVATAELLGLALRARGDALNPSPGRRVIGWTDPWRSDERPRPAVVTDELLQRERALLRPMLDAASTYFGIRTAFDGFEATSPAARVVFDALPSKLTRGRSFFVRLPAPFRRRRVLAEYVRGLGYFADEGGEIRTVPTPETLRRLAADCGIRAAGFRLRLMPMAAHQVDLLPWLELYLEGHMSINVGTVDFYRENRRRLALRVPNRLWCEHFTMFVHDMSVHALMTHRLPLSMIQELSAKVAEGVSRCRHEQRDDAVAPLAMLYEADLPQVCREVWERASSPKDFDHGILGRRADLVERAERRLGETRELLKHPPDRGTRLLRGATLSLSVVEDVWHAALRRFQRSP